ncbi:MAG: Rieske (2Fe-2S) protein [Myxococcota bacterium]
MLNRSPQTRRRFLRWLSGAVLALIMLPATRARARKIAIPLGKVEKLQKVGGSMLAKIKGRDVLLVRDSEKTLRAINPVCTHQKCTVAYNPETKHLHCPCHKSAYTLDGVVLEGPAPKPLQIYPTDFDGQRVVLDLPEPTP